MSEEENMLVDREQYLANGVHIGTKAQHTSMDKYIFHVKKNQLAVLNLDKTDEKIREVAKVLADYDPEEILVVGRTEQARTPIKAFSNAIGSQLIDGRFMPGTLTNPQSENFVEPEIVVVSNPEEDAQAIQEAHDTNIPVIAIADSENEIEEIDHVIPANNKAENALGLVYFLLAREMAERNGEDFNYEVTDFGAEIKEVEEQETEEVEEETDEEDEE
ncbi:30S ribosomal protein S2 [Candidatus Nanohalovita haloferacivicina]|uniref:30S ribosomal protein S2 n=1 Tax=Candidatus Nanohalovita haloferacivicina TaxID=2978046 RepID=UPI00325FBD23|nr:Ribosomal protein S2 [Candidatus Nanohalobia archaeon BNXNv]